MNKYHKVYDFKNGYGASVVWGPGTYGYDDKLFEVAVLKGDEICYDTPISNDVVGYLDFAGVAEILEKIKNLS